MPNFVSNIYSVFQIFKTFKKIIQKTHSTRLSTMMYLKKRYICSNKSFLPFVLPRNVLLNSNKILTILTIQKGNIFFTFPQFHFFSYFSSFKRLKHILKVCQEQLKIFFCYDKNVWLIYFSNILNFFMARLSGSGIIVNPSEIMEH